ncbi:MAG: class I SAM-dependent methyltransferase [Deltaproteobacteria bacterium]|nr:class I SAM-dependent methyltransferase [Deltaproteobacteria bacterium]
MEKDEIYDRISAYWSDQLNNEIYLAGYPGVARGSREYFDIIRAARDKYLYYFDAVTAFLGRDGSGRTLLEVGCGMGTDLLKFAELGYDVTGVDLAGEHIELARACFETYGRAAHLRLGNAEALDFEEAIFDRVYSFGVLHHTPNTEKALREVHRVLKPGGRAFVMLYHRDSLNNLVHALLRVSFENPKGSRAVAADAPVTQRFSRAEVRRMTRCFSSVRVDTEYLYGVGYGRLFDWTPAFLYRPLSKLIGWHLLVFLQK